MADPVVLLIELVLKVTFIINSIRLSNGINATRKAKI